MTAPDQRITAEQVGRAFEVVVGHPARLADILTVELCGSTPEALAEFVWDHWMGEPESPSQQDVLDAILQVLDGPAA